MKKQICDVCKKRSTDLEEIDTGLGMEHVCQTCLMKESDESNK